MCLSHRRCDLSTLMERGIKMKNEVFWNLKRGDYWMQSQVVFVYYEDTPNFDERKYVVLKNGAVYFCEKAIQEIVQFEIPIGGVHC